MRKIWLAIILFFTLFAGSVDAKPCIGCSAELPDNANFCAACMTPQPQGIKLGGAAPVAKDMRESLLDMFAYIDEFEGYFHELKYLNVLGKMPEVKTRFQNSAARYKGIEAKLPEELKILAQVYAAKFQLFEGMTGVMKNLRIDGGYKAAILKSSLVVLALYNRIIDQFRAPKHFGPTELDLLKAEVGNIAKRTQKYTLTSQYLKLGKEKIPGGEKIMVLDVVGKRALVLYMGPTMDNNPLEGWMSLRDLEKRSTWKRENVAFFN